MLANEILRHILTSAVKVYRQYIAEKHRSYNLP